MIPTTELSVYRSCINSKGNKCEAIMSLVISVFVEQFLVKWQSGVAVVEFNNH